MSRASNWIFIFVRFLTAVLIDSTDLTFSKINFNSLRPGCQALQLSIQWPQIKLQSLTDTLLLPLLSCWPCSIFSLPLVGLEFYWCLHSQTPPASLSFYIHFAAIFIPNVKQKWQVMKYKYSVSGLKFYCFLGGFLQHFGYFSLYFLPFNTSVCSFNSRQTCSFFKMHLRGKKE